MKRDPGAAARFAEMFRAASRNAAAERKLIGRFTLPFILDMLAVASGRMLPETMVKLNDKVVVMRIVGSLGTDLHRRLVVDGEPVEVPVPDGKIGVQQLKVEDLTTAQAREAFAVTGIHTNAHARACLDWARASDEERKTIEAKWSEDRRFPD